MATVYAFPAAISKVCRHVSVYEPCEDSFALADALLADSEFLVDLRPSICLEIGSGSGYVMTSLALLFQSGGLPPPFYLATDINPVAADTSLQTALNHDVIIDVAVVNLVQALEIRLAGKVDVLIFNPPYVPTPEEEVGAPGIVASWAGGSRGRRVIDRLLPQVKLLLSPRGCFYLVALSENDPKEIAQLLSKDGFCCRTILKKHTEEETLHILKFWRMGH